ncbi:MULTISPECIES: nucleotidyltransferase family protein [unclassified Halanaerobium]|uniref:nucleotidyltransferase family protein n=1 Tax=unclassified Halanaerobium TaxID=2641197 RepID=UPI000DF4901D|nr:MULTISPECIES: nucleotidyltransferase domain-containing protein [unclassified Halanaerobium]RCW44107.1 hypothetical protein DFR78_1218 [Halanaerobium sp. MA284_MarDTE_T2]RCW86965.1 hypothetical protein DER71_10673 [Halanaerobium sp. DL-01]
MVDKYPLLYKPKKSREKVEEKRQLALFKAKKIAELLYRKYNVKKVILFGSVLKSEDFSLESDIDIAVDGLKEELFFKAYGEISSLYKGISVDFIDVKDCRESIKESILNNGVKL